MSITGFFRKYSKNAVFFRSASRESLLAGIILAIGSPCDVTTKLCPFFTARINLENSRFASAAEMAFSISHLVVIFATISKNLKNQLASPGRRCAYDAALAQPIFQEHRPSTSAGISHG